MDTVSTTILAAQVWNLIAPNAKRARNKIHDKGSEALPESVGKLWTAVKEKMESRPDLRSLPIDLMERPDDEMFQEAFKYQLTRLLENDEAFARQLQNLIHEANSVISHMASVRGDGAVAQGSEAKAVGKGGVIVGGSVNGNIIIGDSNTIGKIDNEE